MIADTQTGLASLTQLGDDRHGQSSSIRHPGRRWACRSTLLTPYDMGNRVRIALGIMRDEQVAREQRARYNAQQIGAPGADAPTIHRNADAVAADF